MGQTGSRPGGAEVEVISLDADVPLDGSSAEKEHLQTPSLQLNAYRVDNSRLIGEGGFATVKLATHRETGHQVAVKVIKRRRVDEKAEEAQLKREVKHQNLLRHVNIVRLHTWLTTPTAFLLVMEFCPNGDMLHYLQERHRLYSRLRTAEARYFFAQLLEGLAFCHSLGISHRDLKLENLMLCPAEATSAPSAATMPCESWTLKIADFGLSDLNAIGEMSSSHCGSPLYAAPELFGFGVRDGFDSSKSDIWSCGVILYAFFTSTLPFDADDMRNLVRLITRRKFDPVPAAANDPARLAGARLVDTLLTLDPSRRPTARAVLSMPWVKKPPAADIKSSRTLDSFPHSSTPPESLSLGELPSSRKMDAAADGLLSPTQGNESSTSPNRRTVEQTVSFYRQLVDTIGMGGGVRYGLTVDDIDAIRAENEGEEAHEVDDQAWSMIDAAHGH